MKQAVISASSWILEHAAPMPISVKYVKTAVSNQAAMAKAVRHVELDEHEMFIKVVRRLLDAGRTVKGLSEDEKYEIYESGESGAENTAGHEEAGNFPLDISRISENRKNGDDFEDVMVCSDFDLDIKDMSVEDVYDLWGWLYTVVGAAKMREMSRVRIEVKFLK